MAQGDDDDHRSTDARIAAKARDQYGLISRTQALALGLSSPSIYRRLRDGEWLPQRCGVYRFAAVSPSWEQDVMAGCLQIPGAVAWGRTAGWIHGLDGLGKSAPKPIELAVGRGCNPRVTDLSIYRVRRLQGEWTHRSNMPVSHLPKTLITLAGLLDPKDGERALDSGLRGRVGLKSWLERELAKYPPRCGGGPHRLRELLKLRKSPTDSRLEVDFEQLLRTWGLPEPTYRAPVFDEHGRIGSIDYIWADHRIVAQTHGWQWHGYRQRWQTDLSQRRRLSVDNWKIIEVTREDVDVRPDEIKALFYRAFANVGTFLPDVRSQTAPGWG